MTSRKIVRLAAALTLACALLFQTDLSAQQKKDLTDPEIASVAVVANQIDINYADIALQKSKDKAIINFAETMKRDHKAVIGQATALVQKLGVTPKDNAVSESLLSQAAQTRQSLQKKSGAHFNKAYIDNEVAYHKAVINAVEQQLIPQADNAELKQLLENVVPALKAHLEHAEMVQKNYK